MVRMESRSSSRGRVALVVAAAVCLAALAGVFVWLDDDAPRRDTVDGPAGSREVATDGGAPDAPVVAREDSARAPGTALAPERTVALAEDPAAAAATDCVVRGVVLDDAGAPIASADVVAWGGDDPLRVACDANGGFEIAWPYDARPRLVVDAAGYASAHYGKADCGDEVVARLEAAATLRVRVYPTTDGWCNLTVAPVGGDGAAMSMVSVEPDEGGAYVFDDVDPGEYVVSAVHDDAGEAFERVDLPAGATADVALHLARVVALRGVVTDRRKNAPVAGAEVTVRPSSQGVSRDDEREYRQTTTTDEDGAYAFDRVRAGEVLVECTAPWGAELRRRASLDREPSGATLDFRVPPPGALAGTVRDANGRPAPGATVRLHVERVRGALLDAEPHEDALWRKTDANGAYAFDDVPVNEDLWLQATSADGDARSQLRRARAAVDDGRRGVDLDLRPLVAWTGRVTSADGAPVADAEVELFPRVRGRDPRWAEVRTDADGAFTIPGALPGTYRLRVRHDAFLATSRDVEWTGGAAPELDVELEPAGVVTLYAVDEHGRAVPRSSLRLVSRDDTEADALRGDRVGSGDYGVTRFTRVAPGRYAVRGGARDHAAVPEGAYELDVRPGDDLALDVVLDRAPRPEPTTVVGSVTDETGAPPQRLRFADRRGGTLSVVDGRFRLTGARPGKTRLTVVALDCMTHTTEPLVLEPGAEYDLGAIRLDPASRVEVEVVDAEGAPVRDARVRLIALPESAGGRGANSGNLRPRSDRRDPGLFPRVPRFAWTLRVDHPDHPRHEQRLDVVDRVVRVRVALPPR